MFSFEWIGNLLNTIIERDKGKGNRERKRKNLGKSNLKWKETNTKDLIEKCWNVCEEDGKMERKTNR